MKNKLNEILEEFKKHEVQCSVLMKETHEAIELYDKFLISSLENYDTFSDKEREKLEEIVNKSVNGIENKLIVTVKYMEENILPLASFFIKDKEQKKEFFNVAAAMNGKPIQQSKGIAGSEGSTIQKEMTEQELEKHLEKFYQKIAVLLKHEHVGLVKLEKILDKEKLEEEAVLSDDEIISIIISEIKKRRDSIVLYEKGNRPELAAKEKKEIEILQKYLPEQISEDELRKIIAESVLKTGAKEMKDMGKVMADLNPKIKGKADGGEVSKIVKELLSK